MKVYKLCLLDMTLDARLLFQSDYVHAARKKMIKDCKFADVIF